mgnify:CR=1 FL=1
MRERVRALDVDHVMASAALPLVFPAVELDGGWFGDGGIRLAAPLSPVLHLGGPTRMSRAQIATALAPKLGIDPGSIRTGPSSDTLKK